MRVTAMKLRRIGMGLTQFSLAGRTGINASRISLIETEEVRPRKDEIEKLSKILGDQRDIFPHLRDGQKEN